jgi:hypothetical protein
MSTISLSSDALKPLILTISGVQYNDVDLDLQCRRLLTYKTPKEQMTTILMTFYLKEGIKPRIWSARTDIADLEAAIL